MTAKKGMHPAIAFVLMLLMLTGALLFGANKHWKGERAIVEAEATGALKAIDVRVETAHNLLTVAYRHLPKDDALITAVGGGLAVMKNSALPLADRVAACDAFITDAQALLAVLAQQESVIADSRDHMYATLMLPQTVEMCEERTMLDTYDYYAAEFNEGLYGSFSGWLARLSGVEPAERLDAETAPAIML